MVFTLVGAGLWLASTSPIFEVSSAILLRDARSPVALTATQSAPVVVTEETLNSEIEIIKGRALLEDVLRTMEAPSISPFGAMRAYVRRVAGLSEPSPFNKTLLTVQKKLAVEAVWHSNVIEIAYRSDDPGWAAQFLTLLIQRYLERRAEIDRAAETVSFFVAQLEDATQRLDSAETALAAYTRDTGMAVPPEAQMQTALLGLGELEQRLAQAEADVQEHSGRVRELESRLQTEPARLRSSHRDLRDPATLALENGLVALRLQRDEMTQTFNPAGRHVRDIERQIRLGEARLAAVLSETDELEGTESNPIHQELKATLLKTYADLDGARARREVLYEQVTAARAARDQLTRQRFGFERLQREATAAADAYLLYRQKNEEARISAAMDVNVTILREPAEPLAPVGPRRQLTLAVALVIGLIGGGVWALGRETFASARASKAPVDQVPAHSAPLSQLEAAQDSLIRD